MATIMERNRDNGAKSFTATIRLKGYPSRTATFNRRTDAKIWIQQTEADLRKGKHVASVESTKHTVSILIDRYIEQILSKRPKDGVKLKLHLNWWKKNIGSHLLSQINPILLAEYRDKLKSEIPEYRKTPRADATIIRYMGSLSHAFTIAVQDWGWLDSNPMLKVKKPVKPRGRVRFLSDDERLALLEECKKSTSPYLYTIVILALTTGARFSEIMNLKWKDIDFKNGFIRLEETKNGERRSLSLVTQSYDLLNKLEPKKLDNYIFARSDGLKPIEIRKKWEKAVEDAGIEDFNFHDLRHTCASYLAMNGATLSEISAILGHKTLQMVKRYSHLTEQHSTEVIKRMTSKIFADL